MPTTPWRIAAQSLTVLDPETKEPAFTLQFIVDHGQADVCRLRMVPANEDGAALEMEFSTGGYPIGTPVKQPRWLRPFERVEPDLYLDDEQAAEEHHAGLSPQQQDAWVAKRDAMVARKREWEKAHGGNGGVQEAAGETGPDSTDPNSPEAQRTRSAEAGFDTTLPADEDRKGMAGQQPGMMAGEVAGAPQGQNGGMNAPNAVDQQRQKQGQPVDIHKGQEQSPPAG